MTNADHVVCSCGLTLKPNFKQALRTARLTVSADHEGLGGGPNKGPTPSACSLAYCSLLAIHCLRLTGLLLGPNYTAAGIASIADLTIRFSHCAVSADHFVHQGSGKGPKKGTQLVLTLSATPLPWEWPQPNLTAPSETKKGVSKEADMVIVLVLLDGRQPRYPSGTHPLAGMLHTVFFLCLIFFLYIFFILPCCSATPSKEKACANGAVAGTQQLIEHQLLHVQAYGHRRTQAHATSCRWTQTSQTLPWHLVLVAGDHMDYVDCPHCLFTQRYSGNETLGRYQLLYRLTQSQQWVQHVVGKHKYIYFPDEAVVHDVSAMST